MYRQLIGPEIRELIENHDLKSLQAVFKDWLPVDLAELIGEFSEEETAIIFRVLPVELAADTFEKLEVDQQTKMLRALGREEVAAILNDMSPDDRTALLEELPPAATRQLLTLLTEEERNIARSLLGYPEDSVGRMMTPDYIAVDENWNVGRVLDYIRKHGRDSETLNVIHVTNRAGKYLYDLGIRQFLLTGLRTRVSDLEGKRQEALLATDNKEKAIAIFKKYDRTALPVVDSHGLLLGIVTVDDVLDVVEEEATEDIQKIGAVESLEEPYLKVPLLIMVQKRVKWLTLLFLGEMITASVMSFFEEEIARAVILALFLPLIISSGGNSGSQATTLIIRAMSLGEIELRQWRQIFLRELFSGLLLGVFLGTIGFVRIAAWAQIFHLYGPHWISIGIAVGLSLLGVVLWGVVMGSMLPFIIRRLGADPAVSSAPFVATLVDVTGVFIYFSVSALILSGKIL